MARLAILGALLVALVAVSAAPLPLRCVRPPGPNKPQGKGPAPLEELHGQPPKEQDGPNDQPPKKQDGPQEHHRNLRAVNKETDQKQDGKTEKYGKAHKTQPCKHKEHVKHNEGQSKHEQHACADASKKPQPTAAPQKQQSQENKPKSVSGDAKPNKQ